MLKSIKWRFVAVYFALVLVSMLVLGLFIVNRLESSQIENVKKEMISTASTIASSTEEFSESNWIENTNQIKNILEEWKINSNYQFYAIYDENIPTIITSVNVNGDVVGEKALSYRGLEPELEISAFKGETISKIVYFESENARQIHIVYPVLNSDGSVNGIFYMIGNLESLYAILEDSRAIFIKATSIALVITILLGYLLASTITGPITDLTKRVEDLAAGDFNQEVPIKGDDEIGKLAGMFNFLTKTLRATISEMDIERAKLNTIFNYMAEGVIALDTENKLIHANQVAKDILNLKKEDIEGARVQDLNKLNITNIDYKDKKTLEGISSVELNDRFYNAIYGPYMDDSNLASGIIIVFQDVTKEHKLDEMRKDFVANVSHELKTPLTTIKVYAETLEDDTLDSEMKKTFLSTINKEVDRMARLVRDLLQLSDIDSADSKKQNEEVEIDALLDTCLAGTEILRQDKNISLEVVNKAENLYINSNKDSLEKILMNIISNAYKYTDDFGKVKIEISDIFDRLKISVKDNGIGIPYKDQKHIFERFYRVEKARSRKTGGTGLGLSIAKELTESLGGEIILKSIPNVGTEIEIIIPKNLSEKPQ